MRPQALKEGGDKQHFKARIFNLSSIGGFAEQDEDTPQKFCKKIVTRFLKQAR